MANLHKSKPDSDDRRRRTCCKRHPKHRQSPGVCSLCLTEKLSQIQISAAARKISDSLSFSSDSSSYYSSASCSSCSSPNHFNHHRRDFEDHDRRKANLMFSMFKKSRSMAIEPRLSESGEKSRLGFWYRFLSRPRRKRNMELMHSSTVVQRNVHG